MNNRFLYTHIIIFPLEGSIIDSMALYQYKKISLYRKNATVVLQVLQKIYSLLTSGQEKKVCKYQSTVFLKNASNQLHLNPSSATVGKTPHNTRPQSGQSTDCLQEDKNWGATKLFSNIIICLSHNNRPSFESIKLLTLTHSSARLEHFSCPAQNFSAE